MLVVQPLADQLPVQVSRGHRAATLARRLQPRLRQLGDERQQPRVTCQIGEVPHLLDQFEAGCCPLVCFRAAGVRVGHLHRQRASEAADQEVMDLFGGELRQPDDVLAERPLDLLPGLFQHLVVGEEELGPACHNDLRPAGGRRRAAGIGAAPVIEGRQDGVEVCARAFVGDAGGEFVETIKNQYQPAVRQHVAKGVEVGPADLGAHQVLGDEPVDLEGLLQVPQLDEHRVDMRQVVG